MAYVLQNVQFSQYFTMKFNIFSPNLTEESDFLLYLNRGKILENSLCGDSILLAKTTECTFLNILDKNDIFRGLVFYTTLKPNVLGKLLIRGPRKLEKKTNLCGPGDKN